MSRLEDVRVFISYAHRDGADLAQRLHADLISHGVSTWLDQQRLAAGACWSVEIERALDACDVVLALLSEGSYTSEVCRGEQMRGLRRNKCVIPILVENGADRPVYLEAKQYIDFSSPGTYDTRFHRLLSDIEHGQGAIISPSFTKTSYNTVPPLPLNYVPRDEVVAPLLNAVLADNTTRRLGITGVHGMGGIGKTIAAQALCHNEIVQDAFPDGIVWLTIGNNPENLTSAIRLAAKSLGATLDVSETFQETKYRTRALMRDKAALIVLDDVWDARHVEHFYAEAPRCRILFTTRDSNIAVALGAADFSVDVLAFEKATELLARYASIRVAELPSEAAGIVNECGGLPLALAMAGAMVRGKPHRWRNALHRLQAADLRKIRQCFPNYAYPDLFKTIQVSVDALDSELLQKRYYDLAVFGEDESFSDTALAVLWECDVYEVQESADRFVDASLASRDAAGQLTVHDLQRDFLRSCAGTNGVAALHDRIVTHYTNVCGGKWASGPNDGYFFQRLMFHLSGANHHDIVKQLLLDIDWLRVKLRHTDVAALIEDYRFADSDPDLRLISSSLTLSSGALTADPDELSAQLIGRLMSCPSQEIQNLLAKARVVGSCLEPKAATLMSPMNALYRRLVGNAGSPSAIAISADGRRIIAGYGDGSVQIWDSETGRNVRTIPGANKAVDNVAFSADLALAVVSFHRNVVKVLEVNTGRVLRTLAILVSKKCPHVHLSRDGSYLAFIGEDGFLQVWNVHEDRCVFSVPGRDEYDTWITLSGNGQYLMQGSETGIFDRWDLTRNSEDSSHKTGILLLRIDLSWDGTRAAIKARDGSVYIWHTRGSDLMLLGRETDKEDFDRPSRYYGSIAISSDGSRVFSGANNGILKVWDFTSKSLLLCLRAHTAAVNHVSLSSDGQRAVSSSHDIGVRVWRFSDQNVLSEEHADDLGTTPSSDSPPVLSVSIDDRLGYGFSIAEDCTVRQWCINTGSEMRSLKGKYSKIGSGCISRNGRVIFTHGERLYCWDLQTASEDLLGYDNFYDLTVGSSGRLLVGRRIGGKVLVFDIERRRVVRTIPIRDRIESYALDSEGYRIALGSEDGDVTIWDVDGGVEVLTFRGHTGPITAVTFSCDGRLVASASRDLAINVWDFGTCLDSILATGTPGCVSPLLTFTGHTAAIRALDFAADAGMMCSVSEDETVRAWNIKGGRCLGAFTAEGCLRTCSFSNDGSTILAAGDAGVVHFISVARQEHR